MECKKCGASLLSGLKSCPNCGEQLDDEIVIDKKNNNDKKNNKFLFIAIAVILIIVLILLIMFFTKDKKKKETTKSNSNEVSDKTSDENSDSNIASNSNSNSNETTNTVTHNGFVFDVPNAYTVSANTQQLILMGKNNTDVAVIQIVDAKYNVLKSNNSILLQEAKKQYTNVSNATVQKYGKEEFIIFTANNGNTKCAIAYVCLTKTKVITIVYSNTSNTLDMNQFNAFASFVTSARFAQ